MFQISTAPVPARLAGTADDYARIGISPNEIKPWEDGFRTQGARGTFEWWYFDAHLDDGSKLVVVFSTRDFSDLNQPLSPGIRIDLTLPDGTAVTRPRAAACLVPTARHFLTPSHGRTCPLPRTRYF